ncbi:MAG: hypothetical protein NC124_13290 [Clostridium sp.]|nr:hypothetical protein [Clostridium sp.]
MKIAIQDDDRKKIYLGLGFSFLAWIGLFCISDKARWIARGIGSGAYAIYGKEAMASSIYKLIIGVFGVLTVVLISKAFPALIEKIGEKLRLDKVGRLTMEIYIIQCLIVESFMPTIYKLIVNRLDRNPLAENVYIYTCFAVIAGWGVLYFICLILGMLKRFPRVKYILFLR